MKKIRVLIIEDSAVIRQFLEHIIGGDPRLEVAASVGSAEEGLEILRRVAPDVISMDIRLPGMNGFDATRRIMTERPTPIVVCSASVESEDLKITMNALRAGALTVVEKPVGATRADYEALSLRLCSQLAIMSEVKVVRQRTFPTAETKPASKPTTTPAYDLSMPLSFRNTIKIVGIGASTGGPNAIVRVLTDLGPGFPLPILLVQHMMPSFLDGFVSWLGGVTPFPAAIARHCEAPLPGRVYLAPADRHIEFERDRIIITGKPPASAQRPSATILFESLARNVGAAGLGILLTGMGDDGADGLVELRKSGGYTIAEHESSAVVYGMPKAALDRGGACEILPVDEIGSRVRQMVRINQESTHARSTPSSSG